MASAVPFLTFTPSVRRFEGVFLSEKVHFRLKIPYGKMGCLLRVGCRRLPHAKAPVMIMPMHVDASEIGANQVFWPPQSPNRMSEKFYPVYPEIFSG